MFQMVTVIATILLVTVLLNGLGLIFFFLYSRHKAPVKARHHILCVLTACFLLFESTTGCLTGILGISSIPCFVSYAVESFVMPGAFATILLR